MKEKNEFAKLRPKSDPYEVWTGFGPFAGYVWKVLKKYQQDDFAPGSKYKCLEECPSKPNGKVVDIGVWDLKKYSMKTSPRTLSIDIYENMTLADLLELPELDN
ncbi:MAG: hypothetical protein Q7K40_03705 [bacterium]|nr:hypothetical protein [bacterium]